jgi:hypothetical protein
LNLERPSGFLHPAQLLAINISSRAGVVEWQTRRTQNRAFSGKSVLAVHTRLIMGGKVQISAREQFSIVINMAEKNLTERTE